MRASSEVSMSLLKVVLLASSTVLVGCAATSADSKRAVGPDIAAEVGRICALPQAERERELEKLKQESGMVLFCGSKE